MVISEGKIHGVIFPGKIITKTLRIKNTGNVKWLPKLDLVLISGSYVNYQLSDTEEVMPGEECDIIIRIISPERKKHRTIFQLSEKGKS